MENKKKLSSDQKTFVHDKNTQDVYDSFNAWIFSADRKLFGKLLARVRLLQMVEAIPGDIVELGVFKGSGVLTWLKALHFSEFRNIKRVVGFDYFDQDKLIEMISTSDKHVMESLFNDRCFDSKGYDVLLEEIINNALFISPTDYELVKGDVIRTLPNYISLNPGFRASLVYFDLDLEEPTFSALENVWPCVSPGGLVVFDEYAVREWTESRAVDRFVAKEKARLISLPYECPTAYIQKPL